MTDTEINIAIAKACGKKLKDCGCGCGSKVEQLREGTVGLPAYCSDLNAMREALLTLDDEKMFAFRGYISELMDNEFPERSTARQQAEAFLRTVGKWVERWQPDGNQPTIDMEKGTK